MKNIFVIYHGRFPGEKAAALFAAKEADSLVPYGQVTLMVPRRALREHTDPNNYYRISKKVQVVYLPVLDPVQFPGLRRVAFLVSYITFSLSCFFYLLRVGRSAFAIITNEPLPAFVATYISRRVVFEVHDFPEAHHGFYAKLFCRAHMVVCTNEWKRREIIKRFSVPEQKLLLERNAVDVDTFGQISKDEARERLSLPKDEKIVVYTGHLYAHKGGETLVEAAKLLPDAMFVFVGGTAPDRERFARRTNSTQNIRLIGQRPHEEIPLWQAAADVLVLPNSSREDLSARYTSPMKLFEYMASGRPIVASRVPAIEELLSEKEAYLVEPDSPDAFAQGIREAFGGTADERVEQARAAVVRHSWSERAARIVQNI